MEPVAKKLKVSTSCSSSELPNGLPTSSSLPIQMSSLLSDKMTSLEMKSNASQAVVTPEHQTDLSDLEFQVQYIRGAITLFFYTIGNIVPRCEVQVIKKKARQLPDGTVLPGFQGIKVDSISSGQVAILACCFKAATVHIDDNESTKHGKKIKFSVDLESLKNKLQSSRGKMVSIYQKKSSPERIYLDCIDADPRRTFQLSTLTNESHESLDLEDLTTSYSIKYPVSILKDFVRIAKVNACTFFQITVKVSPALEENGQTIQKTCVVLQCTDSLGNHQTFNKYGKQIINDQGQHIIELENASILTTRQMDEYENICEHHLTAEYPCRHVSLFLKSLEKGNVSIIITEPGPLVIEFSLGSDLSYMRLIVAPRAEAADD